MLLVAQSIAMPAPVQPVNKTVTVPIRPPPKSDLRFTSACSYLDPFLDPTYCSCTDTSTLGASLVCNVDVLGIDTIGVKADIEPCATPLHMDLDVTEAALGIDYPIANIEAGDQQYFPIPGLDWPVPFVGDAGAQMVVTIDGNIAALRLTLGVDACATTVIGTACGSTLDPADFPINILTGEFNFSDLCTAKNKEVVEA